MTEITRETLELAALAGGIGIEWAADLNGFVHVMPAMCYSPRSMWRPHTDIADATWLVELARSCSVRANVIYQSPGRRVCAVNPAKLRQGMI